MTATGVPSHTVGERTELARYTLPSGTVRIVSGQRVDGIVILIDHPAGPDGRVYLIERGLEQDGRAAMRALIDDYLLVAKRLAAIPVATSPIDCYLHHIDDEP